MLEEQKNEEQNDTLREDLEAKNKALADSLESDIQVSQTEEQLYRELETTPKQQQKIMEDIEEELYTKNKYDYSLENQLDDNEQRKHRLEVLIQSLPEAVNDIQVLKLIKWLCKYKDSFDDLKRDIQWYIEYGNLSETRQEWFEDWYTQVDHLFLYEWKTAIKDIEHTWAKELWKQVKMYWCTNETMIHIFDWVESYGIDIPDYTIAEDISYMWDYHNLEKAYEIDFVVTWLLSFPWSHQQRIQLEWVKKAFPDPLLREILVVAEEEVLYQWWTSTESIWAMAKFATLWTLFRDKIDLSVMTDFHVRQCARLIRDGKNAESIIQNLLNYLWPIERNYEDFDNLVQTLQRMQEIFEKKKKQRVIRFKRENKESSDILEKIKNIQGSMVYLKKVNQNLSDEMGLDKQYTYYVPWTSKLDQGKLATIRKNDERITELNRQIKELQNTNLQIRTRIMRTSEEQKDVDEVDIRIDQIEFFFNNLKAEILFWRDFPIAVVRSLPRDPDWMKLINNHWLWDIFAYFEDLRWKQIEERFVKYFPHYKVSVKNKDDWYEDIREEFAKSNINPDIIDKRLDLQADDYDKYYIEKAIYDLSKFGLKKNVEFSIDDYPYNITSTYLVHLMLNAIKKNAEKEWSNWLRPEINAKEDLFRYMMDNWDTSFIESNLWNKRDNTWYYNPDEWGKYNSARQDDIWNIGMEHWYSDLITNMIQSSSHWGNEKYFWHNHKWRWLKWNFSREKIDKLEEFFIVEDGILKVKATITNNPYKQDLSDIGWQTNTDWQTIWHNLVGDKTLSEELWDKYLQRLWGYNSKKCITETVYRDWDKRKKAEILHTPIQRWLLNGNTLWVYKMNDMLLTRSQRWNMYEMVRRYRTEKNWEILVWWERFNELPWRSLIHMIAEYSTNEEEVAMKLWMLYKHPTLWYKGVSDRSIMTRKQETPKRIKEMLVYINPLTKLSGLQTLAEYGHLDTAEKFMNKYWLEVLWDDDEWLMRYMAGSSNASVKVVKWFMKKREEKYWDGIRRSQYNWEYNWTTYQSASQYKWKDGDFWKKWVVRVVADKRYWRISPMGDDLFHFLKRWNTEGDWWTYSTDFQLRMTGRKEKNIEYNHPNTYDIWDDIISSEDPERLQFFLDKFECHSNLIHKLSNVIEMIWLRKKESIKWLYKIIDIILSSVRNDDRFNDATFFVGTLANIPQKNDELFMYMCEQWRYVDKPKINSFLNRDKYDELWLLEKRFYKLKDKLSHKDKILALFRATGRNEDTWLE